MNFFSDIVTDGSAQQPHEQMKNFFSSDRNVGVLRDTQVVLSR